MCIAGGSGNQNNIGQILSFIGDIRQAQAARESAEWNAKLAETNAQILRMQGDQALERGKLEKQKLSKDVARIKSQGRLAYASGGVQLGTGSPVDWEVSTAEESAYDKSMIDYTAEMEKWGYDVSAQNEMLKAQVARQQGKSAYTAGLLQAGTSLLGRARKFQIDFGSGGK